MNSLCGGSSSVTTTSRIAVKPTAEPLISTAGRIAGVEQIHQLLSDIPAAVTQALLLLCRPAFVGDRFARQIDDGINIIEVMMAFETAPQGDAGIQPGLRFFRAAR